MWTLDAATRRRYVYGMTKLSVWYVHHLLQRGEIAADQVAAALQQRVNLYRLTDLWDGVDGGDNGLNNPAWQPLLATLAGWVRKTPQAHVDRLEEQALALLSPTLDARLPKDVGPAPQRPFLCWTYDLGWAGMADRPGLLGKLRNVGHLNALVRKRIGLQPPPARDAVLHIMNVMVPGSPFDDMALLRRTLLNLIAELRTQHPQVRELWCNTWLNDHPKFREVFPEVWFRSVVVSPPGNFRNWWGQFARRDGDFNERAAQRFREAGGVFRFRALQCHASVEVIEAHLQRLGT